jgi:hypothetical protein
VDIILNLLNDGTFTVQVDVPDFVPSRETNPGTTVPTPVNAQNASENNQINTPQQNNNQ